MNSYKFNASSVKIHPEGFCP